MAEEVTDKIQQSRLTGSDGKPLLGNAPPVDPRDANAFDDPDYARSRKWVLDIIPKTSLYGSIDRYAGGVAVGIFGMIAGAVFAGASLTSPLILGFLGVAVAVSIIGGYAHYHNRKISEPAYIVNREQGDIARAKLYGVHMAKALDRKDGLAASSVANESAAQWRQYVRQNDPQALIQR